MLIVTTVPHCFWQTAYSLCVYDNVYLFIYLREKEKLNSIFLGNNKKQLVSLNLGLPKKTTAAVMFKHYY